MLGNIIFDADNTLWNVEVLYDCVRTRFAQEMEQIGLGPQALVESLAKAIDRKNYELYALSIKRFPQTLVDTYYKRRKMLNVKPEECARRLSELSQVSKSSDDANPQDDDCARRFRELAQVSKSSGDTNPQDDECAKHFRELGALVFKLNADNYPDVRETLQELRNAGYHLYVWTQGNQDVQNQRLDHSGLRDLFDRIKICDVKTADGLKDLLVQWGLDSGTTWFVGDSLKSDIITAVAAGLQAVWIPAKEWDEDTKLSTLPSDKVYLLAKFEELRQVFIKPDNSAPADKGAMVYLFVSAYHSLYRQYVLDILANPRDFTMHFPYRTYWLPGSFKTENPADLEKNHVEEFRAQLVGKRTLIVFTDERIRGEPRRLPNFLPIRMAEIIAAELHGVIIQITFKLLDYVWYPPLVQADQNHQTAVQKYDELIKALPYCPTLNKETCTYISLGPKFDGQVQNQATMEQEDEAWQEIVNLLGNLRHYPPFTCDPPNFPTIPNPFQYAMFYRLHTLTDLKRNVQVPLQSGLGTIQDPEAEPGYLLQSDTQYRLGLLFYMPKRPEDAVQESQVVATLGPDSVLTPIGPTKIPLNFTYDNRNIDFATARTLEDVRGTIALSIAAPNTAKQDDAAQPMSPAPLFLVKVKSNQMAVWIAVVILLIGTIATSLHDEIAQLVGQIVPALSTSTAGITVFVGALGSLLTTGAIWYLYRTLK